VAAEKRFSTGTVIILIRKWIFLIGNWASSLKKQDASCFSQQELATDNRKCRIDSRSIAG
jgi:hypothetical protein